MSAWRGKEGNFGCDVMPKIATKPEQMCAELIEAADSETNSGAQTVEFL